MICYLRLSVLKIVKYILNIIVWTLLSLYVVFMLTFSIPVTQRYAAQHVAKILSRKLGTQVTIDRMELQMTGKVRLYKVIIKDQKGEGLLLARRLSANINLLPLTDGRISISTAQLFGVKARLYRATADSKPNYQFLLDSLASKDTTSTSPLDLRVNSLIMRHSSIRYDQQDAQQTPGQLNTNHLHLYDISSHIVLKRLTEDSLNVNIKRLSLKEQSGLQVDRLRLRFEGGQHGFKLSHFLLRMPNTNVQSDGITARYRFRGNHFVTPSLRYEGGIAPSTVTLSDLACLLPSLRTFQSTLSLHTSFKGEGEELSIPVLGISSTTGDIGLNMNAHIHDLLQKEPEWRTNINNLSLSAKTINFISENLKGKEIHVPQELVRLGSINFRGIASGIGFAEVSTRNHINTDAGHVDLNMKLARNRHLVCNISTKGFDLRRMLDNDHFGTLSTTIDISGILPENGTPTIKANGIVQQFAYNGYHYQNIQLNGSYGATEKKGSIHIHDLNLGLDIEGSIQTSRQQNIVQLTALVDHCSPQAINVSDKWGDASFSAKVQADFTASNINDAVGTLDVTDFTMVSSSEQYELHQLHIESGYQDNIHFLNLQSDFGDVHLRGVFDYQTLPASFTNFIAAKLPTLPGLPKVNPKINNHFSIQANITKSDWLQHLLQVPLLLTKPVTLQGTVNDQARQMALYCELPQFYYDGSPYEDGQISILSPLNKLFYELNITKVMDDGERFNLVASGNAFNNLLTTQFLWDNHSEDLMSGKVTVQASFTQSLDGKQAANIHIAPSTMTVNNAEWLIQPSYITYTDNTLDISHFSVGHDEQFLTLNGRASENPEDSITVKMRDIDVEYVLDLINFHSVDFGGLATGEGSLRAIFGNFEADGELKVRQFTFEHGRMGTLHAKVNWNSEQEQIDIHALADDGEDAQTHVEGYVSPKRNYIDLGIQAEGTHLDFAHSFTSSFTSSVEGHGYGKLRLAGPLDAINLTGDLVANGKVHVSTLNCTYELRNDSLHLVPNEIELRNCVIYDTYGNSALLTGGIHHQELTNLTFDLYVSTRNLLAYDFRDFGEDTFYGTVFARGNVTIRGRENSVAIDADVTPQPGSSFVYNAASPDAISDQEFIEWGSKELQSTYAAHKSPATPETPDVHKEYRTDITMRLKVNANPNAIIRLLMDERTNDYITLQGNGDIQTTFYNKGGFNMFGTYRVTEGTYGLTIQNIIHKNFTFREGGTIVFGGDPYDAALNLQAVHTVNGVSLSDLNVGRSFSNTVRVNCLMNITGQPRQPQVDFDLEMPNVNADEQQMVRSLINSEEEMNQQVAYLLAVGRFYPQGTNNATNADEETRSKTSLAMQSLLSGTLSGQINNVLGRVVKSNNWNFGANISTGDEGWNNAEYEGLISGRLLNNRLLINGQFGYRDNATTANPSFIGDFDIRYLLYPNGNLAMKVYNQTNDRYFTRSSLNTQGIGIIMKKDFSTINDLLGTKRKKKSPILNTQK